MPKPDIREYRIKLPSITLNVLDAGPKDGELIIFLHGFPEYSRAWEKQLSYFAELGYRAVAPDQRGHANSDSPEGISYYTIDKLSNDAFELADALEGRVAGRPFHLVGHDWGAAVTWWAAITQPKRLLSSATLNVPHPNVFTRYLFKNPSQLRRSWYMFFMQIPWLPEWLFKRNNFLRLRQAISPIKDDVISKEQMDDYVEVWKKSLSTMIHWYRATRFMSSIEKPKSMRVSTPHFVLWGKKDAFLEHELAALSEKQCDDGTLEYWDDASHWLVHEFPERTNASLHRFIQQHSES